MAMETIGLGGRLTFDPSRGVAGMNRAAKSFQDLQRKAEKAGTKLNKAMGDLKGSLAKAGDGLQRVSMAALPMTVGIGVGTYKAAQFEQQMSHLRSILRDASEKEFVMLRDRAKELGIVSVFSAKQAGEAMENLAVLGLKPLEVMDAIQPTLDAAAVASIDLASAALYVGGSTRAMGLAIDQTARVADVLTVAGQKSATTLPLMAEALKLAAPSAKTANLSLEETVSILGRLADAQLRGTLGATAFNNMMNKMAKPTGDAQKLLEEMGITFKTALGRWRPIIDIVDDVRLALEDETDMVERSRKQVTIFGLRGARAFSALASAGVKSTKELQNALENSMGAAEQSAKIRLDNIMGAFTLFGASLEGIAIGLFTPFLDAGKNAMQGITESLNSLLLALGNLRRPLREGESEFERLRETAEKSGWDIIPVAQGISEAIDVMTESFDNATDALKNFGLLARDTFGGDTRRELTKFVALSVFFAATVAPIALGLLATKWAVSGLIWMLAPLAKLWGVLVAAFTFASTLTIPMLITKLSLLSLWVQVTALNIWQRLVPALFALSLPVWVAIGAFLLLIGIFKLTQVDGETMTESLSKNWEVGIKTMIDWAGKFGRAIINSMLNPVIAVAKGMVIALDLMGQGAKVPEGLRAFAEHGIQSSGMAGEGVGKIVPFRPGQVPGAGGWKEGDRKQRAKIEGKETGGDMLEELRRQLGETGKGQFEIMEKMMKQMEGAMSGAEKAAKAAADAVKKERCTKVNVDGREVARASSKHQQEIEARSGFKATPWQRSQAVVSGATSRRT